MAHMRTTAFDPVDVQQLKANDGALDFQAMEKDLAREMAKMKIVDEKRKREIEKVCCESDELKELQSKIRAAYLNKERSAQIAEGQFRKQQELEKDADIEIEMLRRKELSDKQARDAAADKQNQLFGLKRDVQGQMQEREKLRDMAYQEYIKEREQVDAIINKMIDEDHEMIRINKIKQEQSKQDMILSFNEKKALVKRQKELDEYEEELVRRYASQQQERADNLQALKDQAEAQREAIFQKLALEEAERRAQKEYIENLRNDLQVEEAEERARQAEREAEEKRLRQLHELQAAKDYQLKLKAERQAEERRMEEEFKIKMAQKFAEDERLEQMNAQKRRMRELQHKRDIEQLWQEKLAVYRVQREQEWEERRQKQAEEQYKKDVIAAEKEKLLREHAEILTQFNPKAASSYGTGGF